MGSVWCHRLKADPSKKKKKGTKSQMNTLIYDSMMNKRDYIIRL